VRLILADDSALLRASLARALSADWLPEGVTVEQIATALSPVLDKPVEIVLPTHGERTDRTALERALS
jgi:hypothetical protein